MVVGWSVCVCSHVFSRTVAAVDTKRGYVGMCNGRSAQQESGATFNNIITRGICTFQVLFISSAQVLLFADDVMCANLISSSVNYTLLQQDLVIVSGYKR